MLSIRLSRIGKKKQPVYRIIVLDKQKDPWGDFIENLGFYNPRVKPREIKLKAERIKYWLEKGAQPTATVHNLLVDEKIISAEKKKTISISKKRRAKLEEKKKAKEAENKEAAEATEAKKEEAPAAENKENTSEK